VGAAVVAASVTDNDYPLVSAARRTAGRMGRYSGAIAAAVVAGGLVLAYGLQTMTPADDPSVSPAGSATEPVAAGDAGRPAAEGYSPSDTPTSTRYSADPIGPAATTADSSRPTSRLPASSAPTTTPTLRPAPDLPRIDWPMDPAPESSSPDAGTSVTVEPSTPVSPEPTTTPAPTTSSPVEPTPAPGETSEPTTPSGPIELSPGPTPRPSAGSVPESSEVPTGSITVPTTVVRGSDPTPELTAPPTVWSPPPAVSGQSVEPRTSPDTAAPRTSEPAQDAQPGT